MKILNVLPIFVLFAAFTANAQLNSANYTCVVKKFEDKVVAVDNQWGQPVLEWKYNPNSAINGVHDAMQKCQSALGIPIPGGHPIDRSSYACVVKAPNASSGKGEVCAVDQYNNCNFSWDYKEHIAGSLNFALNQCKRFRGETLPGSRAIDWSKYSCVDRGFTWNQICLRDEYGNCFQTWSYDPHSAINSKKDAAYKCQLFLSKH